MSNSHQFSEATPIGRLLSVEEAISKMARTFNVKFARSKNDIVPHLRSLPDEAVAHLGQNMEQLLRTFELCASQNVDPWDDREFFQLSMRCLHLSYPSDFLDKVGPEDVVEGYDMQRRQIYRNMRFMEASSYSLIEILSYEWPVLFERSTQITQLLIEASEKILWTENKTMVTNIPKHFIRERHSSSPQACEVHHKYFAPLFSGPGRPAGILSVCTGRALDADLGLSENLAFI